MKTQLDLLKEAIFLAESNPNLKIHICVDSDNVMEYGWTAHQISRIEINPWYENDEQILTDEDEIKEHFEYAFDDNEYLTESQIEEQVNARYEKEVTNAICIYTSA